MSLTDAKIRTLKPTDKPFKVSDSHGLYLLVKPGGSRHWYLKYRINGKESRIALGAYPAVSLSDARQQLEALLNKSDLRRVFLYTAHCSGNAHAFWHTRLRHFVQCTHHRQSLCNLTVVVP